MTKRPEMTHSELKTLLETQAKASLPVPTNGGTALVVDTRDAVERILDEYAPALPTFVNFDGKAGHFALAGTDVPLNPDTRYVARAPDTHIWWLKFNGTGEQPTRIGGRPYDPGFELPSRESLGDADPAQWSISDLTGKPEDPYKLQFMVPIENTDTSEMLAFATMSATGRVAVSRFLKAYNRMRVSHPDELPVIQLRPSSYEHKKFGKVNIPALVIVGRAKADGTTTTTKAIRALTVEEDMDDEIPSFSR